MLKYISSILALAAGAHAQQQYNISVVAGAGPLAVGQSAKSVSFSNVGGAAWDSAGRFYFGAENRVYRVNASGTVDLVIGNGYRGYGGDGGLATDPSVQFSAIAALAVDSSNNLYILDSTDAIVRKVDSVTGTINTYAGKRQVGSTVPPFSGDGGPATNATLFIPRGIAVDRSGNLYISDSEHHRVRIVSRLRERSPPMPATAASLSQETALRQLLPESIHLRWRSIRLEIC